MDSLSIENLILQQINLCRSNPSLFRTNLRNYLQNIDPGLVNSLGISEKVEGLFEFLQNLSPVNELNWSEALFKAANLHCISLSESEIQGHYSLDGSDPGIRAQKYCNWTGTLYENICYGGSNADQIVLETLLYEEDNRYIHRENILKASINYIGISVEPHKTKEKVCVVLLAESITQENSLKVPKKKGPVSEYVKVKEITPKEKLAEQRLNQKKLPSLTSSELAEIKEIFNKATAGNDTLAPSILRNFLDNSEFNESMVFSKIRGIEFEHFDKLESLDFENFVGVITQQIANDQTDRVKLSPIIGKSKKISNDFFSDCKEIFDGIDYEKSGFIDVAGLKAFLAENESLSCLADVINRDEISAYEKLDFAGFLEKMSESELSSSLLNEQSINSNSALIRAGKGTPKNSSFEAHSTTVLKPNSNLDSEKKIKKQVKEVFELLDGDRNGWITPAILERVLENSEFRKKFKLFCDCYQGIAENTEKLTYETLCKACSSS